MGRGGKRWAAKCDKEVAGVSMLVLFTCRLFAVPFVRATRGLRSCQPAVVEDVDNNADRGREQDGGLGVGEVSG